MSNTIFINSKINNFNKIIKVSGDKSHIDGFCSLLAQGTSKLEIFNVKGC